MKALAKYWKALLALVLILVAAFFYFNKYKLEKMQYEAKVQQMQTMILTLENNIQENLKYADIQDELEDAKAEIEASLSKYLQEIRDSAKAEGQDRIYIHGEKEAEAHERVLRDGVYLNDKTYAEMQMIGEFTGASDLLPEYLD